MSETAAPPAPPAEVRAPAKKEEGSFAWFLVKLALAVFVFRTFIFTSFMIPSESMMPRLLVGDYLFAAKWPYGFSRASVMFDPGFIPDGRLPSGVPERGDVVIFKHPVDRSDYVKRVIGLPGDQVQVIGGVLHLNGTAVPKVKLADFVDPVGDGGHCYDASYMQREADGSFACHYPRYRETLPNGVTYSVLDFGAAGGNQWSIDADNTLPVIVPEGRLFLMGDNRDNSLDSRFPAVAGAGIGLVPIDNVVGRASFRFMSLGPDAHWYLPWTWFTGMRWDRVGTSI